MGYLFKLFRVCTFVTVLAFLHACSTTGALSGTDLNEFSRQPHGFNCGLLNLNDSITRLDLRFPSASLTRFVDQSSGQPEKGFLAHVQLFNNYKERVPIDSLTIRVTAESVTAPGFMSATASIRASSGHDYIVFVKVTDLGKKMEYCRMLNLHKTTLLDRNWFACETAEGEIVWDSYLPDNQPVRIIASDTGCHTLKMKAFFHHFPAAAPPFITKDRKPFDYKVDSTFFLAVNKGVTEWFYPVRQGFYTFGNDTIGRSNLTLFKTYQSYPMLNNPKRMLEGLRYLTSNQEYEKLWNSSYPKESVDSFWVANTGSADRAIEMIRKYYQRMEDANRYFFSFCEGWKTDRGLIYVIFGDPNHVFRNDNWEYWIYGEKGNSRSLQFAFIKVDNPFTTNDYILQRQENYKSYWYNAVKLWRR